MRPEDLYELTWVADPRLSPDGRTVAFAVVRIDREANDYASSIWTAPVDGREPPRRFTFGNKADGSPRWSPDGTRIAFLSKRDGDARQLYVIPATGGEALRLTEIDEGASEAVWSPDGSRIAFTSRVRDEAYAEEDERKRPPRRFTRLQFKLDDVGWTGDRRRHVFTVPADGSAAPTQLTHGDFEDGGPTWSPDGTRIAFASARDDDWDLKLVGDIYVVAAEGGEPGRLTGGDSSHDAPSWSPDGSRIACRWSPGGFDAPQHGRIAVVDAGESRARWIPTSHNCPGFPLGVSGTRLLERLRDQACAFGVDIDRDRVVSLRRDDAQFEVVWSGIGPLPGAGGAAGLGSTLSGIHFSIGRRG